MVPMIQACWHPCARPQTIASAPSSSSAGNGRGYPQPAPLRPNLLQPGRDVALGIPQISVVRGCCTAGRPASAIVNEKTIVKGMAPPSSVIHLLSRPFLPSLCPHCSRKHFRAESWFDSSFPGCLWCFFWASLFYLEF